MEKKTSSGKKAHRPSLPNALAPSDTSLNKLPALKGEGGGGEGPRGRGPRKEGGGRGLGKRVEGGA